MLEYRYDEEFLDFDSLRLVVFFGFAPVALAR
jgi:hypothetical protein